MPNGEILGKELYQKRAAKALPILVKQGDLRKEITYGALAEEIGMPNPRNLNDVLDCIGISLHELSNTWGETIPPIQTAVVNKGTGLPSEGIGWLFEGKARKKFDLLPVKERKRLLHMKWAQIYDYPRWQEVLSALGLKPLQSTDQKIVIAAAKIGATRESRGSTFGPGGESAAHKKLKNYVAEHPEILGLPASVAPGCKEAALPSGDRLDVLFTHGHDYIGIEVKSSLSSVEDITRGIFQCVKYCAVIEAEQASKGVPQSARALLVLQEKLPESLIGLRNRLGVEVYDQIAPK
jgi:hypothetical protein